MAKAANRIKALLAKAISTTFENEREVFAAKGFKLAIKYRSVKKFHDMLLKAGVSEDVLSKALVDEANLSSAQEDIEEESSESNEPFEKDSSMPWRTLDGRLFAIGQMDTMHLINIRNYLTRIGKKDSYAYRNIDAEIRSRGPEFPWKPRHTKRISK